MNKSAKNKLIAIFFGIVMLGSVATYALIQAYNFFGTPQQTAQLPSTNIVQGKLSSNVEQLIMSNRGTVVQFYYSSDCLSCVQQKNILESSANQNSQIYLEEIQTSSTPAQNIIITSYKDSKTLTNASVTDIQNAFCDVLLYPPAACAIRNLTSS